MNRTLCDPRHDSLQDQWWKVWGMIQRAAFVSVCVLEDKIQSRTAKIEWSMCNLDPSCMVKKRVARVVKNWRLMLNSGSIRPCSTLRREFRLIMGGTGNTKQEPTKDRHQDLVPRRSLYDRSMTSKKRKTNAENGAKHEKKAYLIRRKLEAQLGSSTKVREAKNSPLVSLSKWFVFAFCFSTIECPKWDENEPVPTTQPMRALAGARE